MKSFSPLVKIPVKFGVIAGILGAVIDIVLYYLGKHPFLFPVYYDFRVVLFCVFMFFTLKEYRDFYKGGILYFWEGSISSFIFAVVFTLVAILLMVIFGTFKPDFLSTYISLSIQQIKSIPPEIVAQIGKGVYQRNLEILPTTTLGDMMMLYAMQSFIIGLFISIILSVILRRQPKP